MPRLPTGPFTTGRTGCFGCIRQTSADGGCGVHGYPCTHYGLDMFATSPEVFAPEVGVVLRVSDGKSAPFVGFGPGVILLQGLSGYYHLLAHLNLSSITVKPGEFVTEGRLLARIDSDHRHTHYEVRKQPTGPSETNNINPATWLAREQRKLIAAVPESSRGRGVAIGVAAVTGVIGLSWLALQIAKRAAYSVS